MSAKRQRSRGRGKKRKNNRRKNDKNNNRNNNSNRKSDSNNNNNRKMGRGVPQQADVGNNGKKENNRTKLYEEEEGRARKTQEKPERIRQARDLSEINNNNNPNFQSESVNDKKVNAKEQTTFNNPSVIRTETSEAKARRRELEMDAKNIKTDAIGMSAKRVKNYGGLNFTLELKDGVGPFKGGGEGSPQLERWRRRLRELLGEREVSRSDGKEEDMVRRRFKSSPYHQENERIRMRRESVDSHLIVILSYHMIMIFS